MSPECQVITSGVIYHEAKMAPKKLRPTHTPLYADAVDLSLLTVSELPGTLWRAKSLFWTGAEVREHLPCPKDDQILPVVLLKGEIWESAEPERKETTPAHSQGSSGHGD